MSPTHFQSPLFGAELTNSFQKMESNPKFSVMTSSLMTALFGLQEDKA